MYVVVTVLFTLVHCTSDNLSILSQKLLNVANYSECTRETPKYIESLATNIVEPNYFKRSQDKFGENLADILKQSEDQEQLLQHLTNASNILKKVCSHDNNNLYPDFHHKLSKSELKSRVIGFIYNHLFEQFDQKGYEKLITSSLSETQQTRFLEEIQDVRSNFPKCDLNNEVKVDRIEQVGESSVAFPGGSFRLDVGFNMSKWITENIMQQANSLSANSSSATGKIVQTTAIMAIVSVIEMAVGIVVDIVPPMIPFPFWIFWSLPCLPLLTSSNCLFSVLYPVSLTDFVQASTADKILDGVFETFPAKYKAKVGYTTDKKYMMCAAAFFGMHCAANFPMCWLPLGIREAMSFPMCFIHCLLTLVACPGFNFEDIEGPCSNISIPPFCSFSIFTNFKRIPPQYVSYNDSHLYPAECPLDNPTDKTLNDNLSDLLSEDTSDLFEDFLSQKPKVNLNEAHELIIGSIDDYLNVKPDLEFECDCDLPCHVYDVNISDLPCQCSKLCAKRRQHNAITELLDRNKKLLDSIES